MTTSRNDIEELVDLVQECLSKMRLTRKGRTLYHETSTESKVFDIIRKIGNNDDYLTIDDISNFIGNQIEINEVNILKSNLLSLINSEPRQCESYFKIGKAHNFDEGYSLGIGKLLSGKSLSEDVKRNLGGTPQTSNDTDWYLFLTVKAKGKFKAIENSIAEVKRCLAIYKFVFLTQAYSPSVQLETKYQYSAKFDGDFIKLYHSFATAPLLRDKQRDIWIEYLNEVVNLDSKSEIEERIINVVDMYGLIDTDTPLHTRFAICVIALEGLLITGDDKDGSIRNKIGEKVALLIGDTREWMSMAYGNKYNIDYQFIQKNKVYARSLLDKRIRRAYDLRSSFAHYGVGKHKGRKELTAQDFSFISNILFLVMTKILILRKEFGITKIQGNSPVSESNTVDSVLADNAALDVYLQKLRYG